MSRPTWHDYFIGLAYIASTRSHDTQTQVGCVIVKDKKVISMGYNGFCSGIEDEILPTVRPDKYPLMVHAEENAVSNMIVKPDEAEAYITHRPCHRCAKLLWQNNIRTWYMPSEEKAHSHSRQDDMVYELLLINGLRVGYFPPDLSYLNKIVDRQKNN